MNKQSTAILLFSRTAIEEQSSKTFSYSIGAEGNRKIAENLIQNSIAVAKKTNLPLFTCFTFDQKGTSFGHRLANAIESIYAQGFENVIAIGNDCPKLSSQHILLANDQLQHNDLILGPAKDGGVYLIGINKSAYHRNKFINLDWGTSNLQKTFKQYIAHIQKTEFWLNRLEDVDCPKGLKEFLERLTYFSIFIKRIKQVLASTIKHVASFSNVVIFNLSFSDISLRAPPSF